MSHHLFAAPRRLCQSTFFPPEVCGASTWASHGHVPPFAYGAWGCRHVDMHESLSALTGMHLFPALQRVLQPGGRARASGPRDAAIP
eukprot:216724-Chlamydomonas_euryale.AAC.1